MVIDICTADGELVQVVISDDLYSIFVEDFDQDFEALGELSEAFKGTSQNPDDLSDMVDSFMVGWIRQVVKNARRFR